jgi:hypothetical protein
MVHWEGCSVAEATWETDLVFYQQHYPAMLAAYNDSRVPERVVGAKLWYHPVSGEKHYKVRWQGTSWTTRERAVTLERNPADAGLLADFRARAARTSRTRSRRAGEANQGTATVGRSSHLETPTLGHLSRAVTRSVTSVAGAGTPGVQRVIRG